MTAELWVVAWILTSAVAFGAIVVASPDEALHEYPAGAFFWAAVWPASLAALFGAWLVYRIKQRGHR